MNEAAKQRRARLSNLFVLKSLDLEFLARLRVEYPDSRSVHWDPAVGAAEPLAMAAGLAERVIVQDGLAAPLLDAEQGEVEVQGLSEFSPELARELARRDPAREAATGRTLDGVFEVAHGPILFCPSNDTHTKLFEPIARHLSSYRFLLHDHSPEERAREMLESLELAYEEGGAERLAAIRPSVIVVGNDWNDGVWSLFERAYKLKIPTVCVQEGCLDFATCSRMQFSDYALTQGPVMLQHFRSPLHFLSGNPRFDALAHRPLPQQATAMLNCNFTYGVEEDSRESWIGDITAACRELGLEYFISQHPRDTGVFPDDPVRPSHAGVVHDHLGDSSVLVTRFSTLVYEALLAGRSVVYYNPHGEAMRLFNEDDTGGIHRASDRDGLRAALAAAREPNAGLQATRRELFLKLHCGRSDGRAAWRSAAALAEIAAYGSPRTGPAMSDWYRMWRRRRRTALKERVQSERQRLRAMLRPIKKRLVRRAR